ncbi:molecular chaperone DnaJ [Paenibacillus sp. CAA11]|uniref:J domain-containing protein n=1 Tax=Paenibacillus sp. CAA11 TaxID=1532905 RepID=UPI000D38FC77|nr:DnaJ domain-containing protein [Paenibacillus sp. CAA11]AWB43674.1 molecular chaperone DnaJ [Paenibacillus sp. CAA11]
MINYYEQLGITSAATEAEIRQAYRKLAKQYHPDVNGGSAEASLKFKQIVEAYQTLNDPQLRLDYDRKLTGEAKAGQESGGTARASQAPSEAKSGPASFDPNRVREHFAQFFSTPLQKKEQGNSSSHHQGSKKNNVMDTTDIFNHFFGVHKK